MKAPLITLKCDCGEDAKVAYGERWTCGRCGRSYDTSRIPVAEYQAIRTVQRRFRVMGFGVVAVIAAVLLFLAVYGYPFQMFLALPMILLVWFIYVKPLLRRRYRRALAGLPTWELRAEGGPDE
ncbi:MAG: hypothetical protein ACXVYV_04105 [Gaiellales bacterium]